MRYLKDHTYMGFSLKVLFSILMLLSGTSSVAQSEYSLTLRIIQPKDSLASIEYNNGEKFLILDSFNTKNIFKKTALPFDEPTLIRIRNNGILKAFMAGRFKTNVVWDLPQNKLIVESEDDVNVVHEIFQNSIQQKYAMKFFELNGKRDKQLISYDTIIKLRQHIQDSLYTEVISFIKQYNTSFYSLHLLRYYSSMLNYDITTELYNSLDIRLKEFPSAKKIEAFIEKRKEYFDLSVLKYYSNSIEKNKKFNYYIIDFWGSWCKPCVSAIPKLQGMQKNYENKKVQFISISFETKNSVDVFLQLQKKFYMPWPQVLIINDGSNNTIIDTYSITDFPTYLLLDAKHKIVLREVGESGLRNIENFLIKMDL